MIGNNRVSFRRTARAAATLAWVLAGSTLAGITLAGCEATTGPEGNDPADTGAVTDTTVDTSPLDTGAVTDTGGATDTGGIDTTPTGAGFGEPCLEDTECASRFCLLLDAGSGLCSQYCADTSGCPDGWDCILFAAGSEAARVCVGQDICFDDDGDTFGTGPGCQGPDCDEASPLINPAADEVCDGADNDCDGGVDERPVDANLDCDTGFPGICSAGRTICSLGAVQCIAQREPQTEVCDNVDNDCDGAIDNDGDAGVLRTTCYGGPAATLGVGTCVAGTRACTAGQESDCEGQVLPFPELCDGLDNDCDGEVDEGDPGAGLACTSGQPGICGVGITACVAGVAQCIPSLAPGAEVCDGLDNDCDGTTDEDDAGVPLVAACFEGPDGTLGVGACVGGVRTCTGGEFGACVGDVTPLPETCNGVDDNCDGVVDEDNPGAGVVCSTGQLGVCATGVTTCTEGATVCVPNFAPGEETCDGLDNNCNGLLDEADEVNPLTRTCYDGPDGSVGIGQCRSGLQACVFGAWASCVGQVVPTDEVCDEIDNDCDTSIDEDVTLTYWADADDDNYGDPASPIQACFRPAGYANNTLDCYDGNPDANPRQRGYFVNNRGDGSFDYNCDGNAEQEFTGQGQCASSFLCDLTPGWDGTVPGCGQSGAFVSECRGLLTLCFPTSQSAEQACR